MEQAVNTIVERHESLRTHFIEVDGEPLQVVAPGLRITLPLEDLSRLESDAREQALAVFLRHERETPFLLSQGPLLRARLLRLAADEHLLVYTFHHIVFDGWSIAVFNRELSSLYKTWHEGRAPGLEPLPFQYADYALWQRRWLHGEELERQTSYWRGRLAGAPTLGLDTDHPRPATMTFAGGRHDFFIPAPTSARLRDFNLAERVTPFMSLLSVFQVLLARYSGQSDILVGTPIANRRTVELENLIGFFVNTLVLRTDISDRPCFRALAARVRDAALDAYEHQDLPFEKLVEELNPERDLSRHPIFHVLFALQNAPAHPLTLAEVNVTPYQSPPVQTHFDLELHLRAVGDSWAGSLIYNTDLFAAATIRRMGEHFLTLLVALLAEPERSVTEVQLLTAAERQRLLVEWNATGHDYPRDSRIHELFEKEARLRPDAIALELGAERMTYDELNRRSDYVARNLRGLGVQPGDLVGVSSERSFAMVAGLLGILKAGSAYWALEENLPQERLRFLIDDARPALILTGRDAGVQLAGFAVTAAVQDLWASAPEPVIAAVRPSRPADPAYVSYTSGSTGRPKGVVVPHRGVVRLVKGADYVSLTPDETLLHLSPLTFDASTFELWGALLNGGRVVLLPPGLPVLAEIGAAIRRHGVTTLWLTAGLFHLMVDERLEDLKPLRQLLAGGDVLCPTRVAKARRALPGCRLINGYGPTENTTFTCCHTVAAGQESRPSVPIGRPIANTRVYILDGHLQPVPVGVAGELYAGGDGVARGYLNQPQLTAESFIPDPFSTAAGARLYRTGDRVRWRSDGVIEFLGRMDTQVKIRGFRVELGEIEAALRACRGVREAVVIRREDRPVDSPLVGYVVAGDRARPAAGDLQAQLRARLPDYMVPAAFIVLDRLPLLPSGKLDRLGLPAPAADAGQSSASHDRPRDLLELELIRIWQRLFNRQDIGRTDDFFKLGGHSLLAVRLAAEIDKLVGRVLPIAVLFQAATVETLTRWLTEEHWAPPWGSLVPLQPLGSKPPLFLMHGLYGGVYGYLGLTKLLAPDQPVYGLQAVGLDGRSPYHTTLEEMAAHYAREIISFQHEGPCYLGGYSLSGLIAFEVAQQLHRLGRRVALLALFDSAPIGVTPWFFRWLALAAKVPSRCVFHFRGWRALPRCKRLGYLREHWPVFRRQVLRNRPNQPPAEILFQEDSLRLQGPEFARLCLALGSTYHLRRYPGAVDVFMSDDANTGWGWYWRYLARGGLSRHRVPGLHLELFSPDNLPALATLFSAVLDRAQQRELSSRACGGHPAALPVP